MPVAALWPVALAAELVGRITGREPFVTLDGLRMAKKRMFFTSAKAERELGYRARPALEGSPMRSRWFRAAGMCRERGVTILAGDDARDLALSAARPRLLLAAACSCPQAPDPARWPSIAAVVPARDEAGVSARRSASLLAQDYPGAFSVVLVDDHSSDGTAARRACRRGERRARPTASTW